TNVTKEAGIKHQYEVFEGFFGGGLCVFDFNNDGYQDVYLTSGLGQDQLLLNQKDGTFMNIFVGSGLEETSKYVTLGVVSADINKDGFLDLYITTSTNKDLKSKIPRAKNLLFLNQGNNTFKDVTAQFGLDKFSSFSTGAAFGDFNNDGYPDLYVGNYFQNYEGPLNEISDATIVNAASTAKDLLLLNQKGKSFKNVYEDYGLDHVGFGFGANFTDFDNDGDLDLIVINDFGYKAKPNYFLRNEFPKKKFTYLEKELGMDLRINAMTAATGDYDYFITNIKFNRFMVYENGKFVDKARELGTSFFTISWGANFGDYDHDGDLDLFVLNGDLNPYTTPMGSFLFMNDSLKFKDIAFAANINDYGIGRGSV
nr:VCBS repeat-containing protein [Saprospiraceae bacterium]